LILSKIYTPYYNHGEEERGERREVKRIVSCKLNKLLLSLLFSESGKIAIHSKTDITTSNFSKEMIS